MLRGVDQSELIAGIGEAFRCRPPTASGKVLADDDVAALFGIDMGETAAPDARSRSRRQTRKAGKGRAWTAARIRGTARRAAHPEEDDAA